MQQALNTLPLRIKHVRGYSCGVLTIFEIIARMTNLPVQRQVAEDLTRLEFTTQLLR